MFEKKLKTAPMFAADNLFGIQSIYQKSKQRAWMKICTTDQNRFVATFFPRLIGVN